MTMLVLDDTKRLCDMVFKRGKVPVVRTANKGWDTNGYSLFLE